MSNYVNNVNVGGNVYTLGPLMSTPSGGVVDNNSNTYSDGKNVIIAATQSLNSYTNSSNIFINCSVDLASLDGNTSSNVIIGGNVSITNPYAYARDYSNNTFLNCSISSLELVPGYYSEYASYNRTYIGVSASHMYEELALAGCPNVIMGTADGYTTGIHGIATSTLYSWNNYMRCYTGMFIPYNSMTTYGVYRISVMTPFMSDCSGTWRMIVVNNSIELPVCNSTGICSWPAGDRYETRQAICNDTYVGWHARDYGYDPFNDSFYFDFMSTTSGYALTVLPNFDIISAKGPLQITVDYDVIPGVEVPDYSSDSGSSY